MKHISSGSYAKAYYAYTNNSWVEKDLWVKIDGAFHQLVPPNCIIMYDTTSHGCVVADGSNGTVNLIGRFPRLGLNKLASTIGSEYHDGTEHGYGGGVWTSYYNHSKDMSDTWSLFGNRRDYINDSSHRHSVSGHYHSGLGSNIPTYKGLVPTMFNDVIYKDAVFLNATSITEQTWLQIVIYFKQLRFTSTPQAYYPLGHTHDELIINTESSTFGITGQTGINWGARFGNHVHTANHTMNNVIIEPYAKNFLTYQTKSRVFFDQLISGTVVLCTTSYIPAGWSRYTPNESGVYMGYTSDGYIGSDVHNHGTKTITTGNPINGWYDNWRTGSYGFNKYSITGDHTHAFEDFHPSAYNIPPSVALYGIIKN